LPKLGVLEDQAFERALCVSVLAWLAMLISSISQRFVLGMAVTALAESVCLLGEGEGCAYVAGSLVAVG
jgi:hypothetical protein